MELFVFQKPLSKRFYLPLRIRRFEIKFTPLWNTSHSSATLAILTEKNYGSGVMEAHRSYLKDRIAFFIKETNSEVAKKILEDFEKYQNLFWIITPYAENLARIIKNTREEAA